MRFLLPASIVLYLLLLAGSVWAEPVIESSDSIHRLVFLNDGSVYAGELVALEPQKQVTIRLVDGSLKRFRWSLIRRMAATSSQPAGLDAPGASQPHEQHPAPRPSGEPRAGIQAPESGRALLPTDATVGDQEDSEGQKIGRERHGSARRPMRLSSQLESFGLPLSTAEQHPEIVGLQIDSPVPVRLRYVHERATFDDAFLRFVMWPVADEIAVWRTACKSPCDAWVYRQADYKITGSDITTASVSFPNRGKQFRLVVRPGSPVLRGFAWAALLVGSLASVTGLSLLAVPGALSGESTPGLRESIAGLNIGGVSMLLLSIPLFVGSRTGYQLERTD